MKVSNPFFLSSLFLVFLALGVNGDARRRADTTATPAPPTTTPTPTSTSASSTSTTPSTTPSSTSSTPTSTPSSTSTTPSSTTQGTPTSQTSSSTPVQLTTVAGGVTVIVTQSITSSSSSASASATSAPDESSSGLGTGSIVGLSVAGGIAVIGIIAFFVWKFTRKRFSDFDDNEAIKWPDLNTHGAGGGSDSHPLPVNNTGRSGFDTGSEGSLSRVPSTNYSTPDLNSAASDPYAVPPLPHLNPNQPYRDDPGAVAGYYDPYRGPIPGTIEQGPPGGQGWGGEAIPMTQMNAAGRMSPGPHAAYGGEQHPAYDYDAGRQSPGPQAAYGGRTSPGPQAAYGGRMSPGPHAAYGGAVSPAPAAGYGGR